MLSRRNVRIKILQLLYTRSIIGELTDADIIAQYRRMLDDTFDLYLFSLYIITAVARESNIDLTTRAKKHLPSAEDKVFTARLYNNPLIQSLENNEDLQERFKQLKFDGAVDEDLIRQIYINYSKEEGYVSYASQTSNNDTSETEGILDFYRFLRKSELFEEMLEDRYYAWLDDKSLVIGSMKKTIKALPLQNRFFDQYQADDQTTEDFGMTLLLAALEDEDKILAYIQPKLQNWEMDRLATLDMIILKMSIAEMIKFPSIPTKATINEYVEIAKNYSTDKSKEFVNGILDSLMKDLVQDGIIVKTGRGLK
jgi:N utilization substance protein B